MDARLELTVKSLRHAAPTEQGIRVEFDDGSALAASRVVLGTGACKDCLKLPLIASMATQLDLPVQDGLPLLSVDLEWGDQGVHVVGALAAGQLGPDSGNLTGARRAATICAEKVGVFDYLSKSDTVRGNPFSALADALSDGDSGEDVTDSSDDWSE